MKSGRRADKRGFDLISDALPFGRVVVPRAQRNQQRIRVRGTAARRTRRCCLDFPSLDRFRANISAPALCFCWASGAPTHLDNRSAYSAEWTRHIAQLSELHEGCARSGANSTKGKGSLSLDDLAVHLE
jgi:hypothetical protein